AVPELVKALEQLGEEKFPKLMAYLNNPVSRRVRTNNHVERTNRMFRFGDERVSGAHLGAKRTSKRGPPQPPSLR
ncbi:MAG TPA: hypothetical protein VKP69_11990, partial [Isosphaeraceae bacterium]|nr:hypothetical protein [Isosphaeraceae bacterium]